MPRKSWVWALLAVEAWGSSACAAPRMDTPSPPLPAPVPRKPDLPSAQAPDELVLIGRWRNPSAFFEAIMNRSGVTVNWQQELRSVLANDIAVRLDRPIEFAVTFDAKQASPTFGYGYSAELRSLQDGLASAQSRGLKLFERATGVHGLRGGKRSCAIASSQASTEARLVCGSDDRLLDSLLPYLTRGLPAEELPEGDIVAEIKMEGLQSRLSQEATERYVAALLAPLGNKNKDFDRLLDLGAKTLSAELFALTNDVSSARLTVQSGQHAISVDLAAKLRTRTAWSASAVLDRAPRHGTPSDFWALPMPTRSAAFHPGLGADSAQAVRRFSVALLSGLLDYRGGPVSGRQQVLNLFGNLPVPAEPVVMARGRVPAPRRSAKASRDAPGADALDWFAITTNIPLEKMTRWLEQVGRTLADPVVAPQLRRLLREALDGDPLAKLSHRKPRQLQHLPKGSEAFDVELAATLDKAAARDKFVLLLVPDRNRNALVGASGNEVVLTEVMRGWLERTKHDQQGSERQRAPDPKNDRQIPVEQTLRARTDLALLEGDDVLAGGFWSVGSVMDRKSWRTLAESYFKYTPEQLDRVRTLLERVPGRGSSPFVFRVAAETDGVSARLQIPTAALADALLVVALLQSKNL